MGVAFYSLPDDVGWRFMLGSSCVPPLFVMAQVYFCPESPRWLLQNHKVEKAYHSFRRIRNTELEACRDLFYTYVGVELERRVNKGKNFFTQLWELFSIPRNARATMASWIIMFGQQFCGVNVIAYVRVTAQCEKPTCSRLHSIPPRSSSRVATVVHKLCCFPWAPVSSIGSSPYLPFSRSILSVVASCCLSRFPSWPSPCSGRACHSSLERLTQTEIASAIARRVLP